MNLSDAEIAELADHEAVPLGLPRRIEAWLSLHVEGRLDSGKFAITLTVEPLRSAQPWYNYRRRGAILEVGEHAWRLTPKQLAVFNAYEQLRAAGNSVEARLRAWPVLETSLLTAGLGHVRVSGHLPRAQVVETHAWPEHAMTRIEGKLRPAGRSQASWAMGRGHRYYLRAA